MNKTTHLATGTMLVLASLALPSAAWADLVGPTDPLRSICGLLGGATLSLMLTIAGCWAVWSCRRSR